MTYFLRLRTFDAANSGVRVCMSVSVFALVVSGNVIVIVGNAVALPPQQPWPSVSEHTTRYAVYENIECLSLSQRWQKPAEQTTQLGFKSSKSGKDASITVWSINGRDGENEYIFPSLFHSIIEMFCPNMRRERKREKENPR